MKILGHPIHILLIHFPAALIPMDFACSCLQYYMHNDSFGLAAFYATAGVVVLGWLAIVFGFIDLIKIPAQEPQAQKIALIHGSINSIIIIVYTILGLKAYKVYPGTMPVLTELLIVKAVLLLSLVVGNYLGGNLVLKYGIGTENKK
jgi:uncharacterized membrane protein